MTLEHHHKENWLGCDAIVEQVGNELSDWEVHIYYCKNPATHYVYYYSGKRGMACEGHARQWSSRLKVRRMRRSRTAEGNEATT